MRTRACFLCVCGGGACARACVGGGRHVLGPNVPFLEGHVEGPIIAIDLCAIGITAHMKLCIDLGVVDLGGRRGENVVGGGGGGGGGRVAME